MQQAFQAIKRLVADFKAQEAAYLSPGYQESQVRQDFIDKFFTALGWDVTHERQKNPYEQEVHIENKVKMSGSSQRRADYAFFLSPNFRDPKFFVEAKKPSRNLANADDYYQAIRYGWNAKTPLAILTDFEEFHILDCRFKPDISSALSRKIASFHYTDYASEEKFANINYLFSRDAVAAGSIEKRATELLKPRGKGAAAGARGGYQAVDDAFLEELDEYRGLLAKAFKRANEKLDGEELTEAVQRTIDRLVFIRFLEDKGIEEKSIINIRGQKSPWKAFIGLCKRNDPKYNGLVFKSHRILDEIALAPADEETFAEICAELADPGSPYDFNQIPISILGSIYERFLGKVVHATDKRVKVEEKPEVRKAGGVYYTPEYIVRYIVKETVGKLIEGKTPGEIASMAFADIACGSGSFLIEVYAQLLDYHVKYYLANREKAKPDDVFERDGKLHLSLKKKKEILLNNIYGVDIDFQATEVTQLSLYLKLLEDATMNDAHQFGLFKETILPDLKQNVVCGNSLIGTDIRGLFADADVEQLRPMNFEDAFPDQLKKGGFDVVVGNPPYVRIQTTQSTEILYFSSKYKAAVGNYDIYCLFVERANSLLKAKGQLGYILPHRFLKTDYGEGLRRYLSSKKNVKTLIDFDGFMVFEDASINTCVLIQGGGNLREFSFGQSHNPKESPKDLAATLANLKDVPFSNSNFSFGSVSQKSLSSSPWIFFWKDEETVRDKLFRKQMVLAEITSQIFQGLKTGSDPVFIGEIVGQKTSSFLVQFENGEKAEVEKDLMKPLIKGGEMMRYQVGASTRWILFPYDKGELIPYKDMCKYYPKVMEYLQALKPMLVKRESGKMKGKDWYGYTRNQALSSMYQQKIVTPDYYAHASYCYDAGGRYFFCGGGAGGYGIVLKPGHDYRFILGLLNSKLLDWYLHKITLRAYQTAYMYVKKYIEQLPIYMVDFSDAGDKTGYDHIVHLVEEIQEAKQKLAAAKTDAEINRHEHLCSSLDRQIDQAVYKLYGLTEEEIKIVEGTG